MKTDRKDKINAFSIINNSSTQMFLQLLVASRFSVTKKISRNNNNYRRDIDNFSDIKRLVLDCGQFFEVIGSFVEKWRIVLMCVASKKEDL